MASTSRVTRRRFLAASGAAAAAGASLTTRGAEPVVPSQPANSAPPVPGVSAETIPEAEKLAGIEFTPAERETMRGSLPEQVAMLRSRQRMGALPNELAPALVFDPRPAGFSMPAGAAMRRTSRAGDVPSDEAAIAFAPVSSLSRWIESKRLTSERLTRIYLDRIKTFDGKLKAVITLCEGSAMAQAKRADAEIAAGKYRGPLHGIPWGAKDLLDTKGIRTTWGAEPFKDRVPQNDAAVVRMLNDAGAVLVAKLSLGALAYGDIWQGGRTNNPWNISEGSSGSSAGSAACVAAGLVGFAIGTETYGSILSPSMRCGTTGLRPTFGRVSRAGAMALCWSLDKIGPIARSVEDAALVLGAINGYDAADSSSIGAEYSFDVERSVKGLKVGFHPAWFEGQGANDVDRAALSAMKALGVDLIEVDLPEWPYESLLPILVCEAASAFEDLTRSGKDDQLSWQAPEAWPNTFRQSWFIPANEVMQSDRFRRMVMGMMAERFAKVDVIFAPSFAASLCLITNFTGHPQLTLRAGMKENGTPHGVSLWGRLFDEGTLCSVGLALERSLGVWDRRPALS